MVLLHGFIESLQMWDDYARHLAKKHKVVCIDLPGHGKSDCIGHSHSMELIATAVHGILKTLRIKKCVMAGHSMGGYVTLSYYEKYPEMVSGFCLLHSHCYADSTEKKHDRKRAIKIVRRNPKVLIGEIIPNLFAPQNVDNYNNEIQTAKGIAGEMSGQGIINCLEGMRTRKSKQHVLKETQVPVLIILGKQDPVMSYARLKGQFNLSNNIQGVLLESAGHMGFIEAKKETLNHIKLFINKCMG